MQRRRRPGAARRSSAACRRRTACSCATTSPARSGSTASCSKLDYEDVAPAAWPSTRVASSATARCTAPATAGPGTSARSAWSSARDFQRRGPRHGAGPQPGQASRPASASTRWSSQVVDNQIGAKRAFEKLGFHQEAVAQGPRQGHPRHQARPRDPGQRRVPHLGGHGGAGLRLLADRSAAERARPARRASARFSAPAPGYCSNQRWKSVARSWYWFFTAPYICALRIASASWSAMPCSRKTSSSENSYAR